MLWATFLRAQPCVFVGMVFVTVEAVTGFGVVHYQVLFATDCEQEGEHPWDRSKPCWPLDDLNHSLIQNEERRSEAFGKTAKKL